jgi:hypothetical protein
MLQKILTAFGYIKTLGFTTKSLLSNPPCEQQQLVKLCYRKYEGHLGKLKCIAFLPSGPQTMNNLLTKLLTAKN